MHTESFECRGVSHVGHFRDYDPEAAALWRKSIEEHKNPRKRLSPEDCLTLAQNAREPQPASSPAKNSGSPRNRKR